MRIIVILIGLACFSLSLQLKKKATWKVANEAPGIVFIEENWGIDQTECTNFNWLEFLFWTSEIYGKNSPEYKAILPDTAAWNSLGHLYEDYDSHYLRHPAYRNFPVVGVSYQQMQAYCQWRSDRVFEYKLVTEGFIPFKRKQQVDSIISIKALREGKLSWIPHIETVDQVPHYQLPTPLQWGKAVNFAENEFKKLSKRKIERINRLTKQKEEHPFPSPVEPNFKHEQKKCIYLLNLNMSEQLRDEHLIVGQNWLNNKELDQTDVYKSPFSKNPLTLGFRCVLQ
jgi:hypothetical protein